MQRALKQIFISYAHENRDIAKKLSELDFQFPNVDVRVWSDGLIRPGSNWNKEIHAHLEQADLAVLLISGAFGGSSYINCNEIPVVLDRVKAGKSGLLWVAVDEAGSKWAEGNGFGALQAAAGRKYLRGLDDSGLSTVLSEVRRDALGLLDPDAHRLHQSLNAKYQLKGRLGGGRSWHIYLAGDRMLRRDVAVYCPADAEQRKALEKTVTSAAEHANPSMATIYGAWLDASPVPHVIAQYASRGTLAKRLAETYEQTSGGLPCEEVRKLIVHLARALAADAHGKAELLELRPSKVLVDEAAGYLISPFGRWRWRYGRKLRSHLHSSIAGREERAYVARELLLGAPSDPDRTYQYLLGLLAWHAIVGKLPSAHDGVDAFPDASELPVFVDHLPSPNADRLRCSPWLAELVVTMTAREPSERLDSLEEVVKRLAAAPAEELGLVRISYERCLQSEGGADAFFGQVYEHLKGLLPEGEWKKFRATLNWHMQRANLAEAIALLLAFYAIDATNQEPTALSRIARKHGQGEGNYNIAPESFPLFQRALIETVINTLKPSSPEEHEGLKKAWSNVLKPGIKYLARQVAEGPGDA